MKFDGYANPQGGRMAGGRGLGEKFAERSERFFWAGASMKRGPPGPWRSVVQVHDEERDYEFDRHGSGE